MMIPSRLLFIRPTLSIASRLFSDACETFHRITYDRYGDAATVTELQEATLNPDSLDASEVSLKLIAAPINPADINMIEGHYPIKPDPPCVGGNEGVFRVLKAGTGVSDLLLGDWVIPSQAGFGTWQTRVVCSADKVLKVSTDLTEIQAATLSINPCTAYRMLKDYCSLNSGELVIQNAANSAVGTAAIQIAHQMGLRTINVVRTRPNFDELKSKLTDLGADIVVTDEFLLSRAMRRMVADDKPKGPLL